MRERERERERKREREREREKVSEKKSFRYKCTFSLQTFVSTDKRKSKIGNADVLN